MKMEVLSAVQNHQYQGQFGVIGSTKVTHWASPLTPPPPPPPLNQHNNHNHHHHHPKHSSPQLQQHQLQQQQRDDEQINNILTTTTIKTTNNQNTQFNVDTVDGHRRRQPQQQQHQQSQSLKTATTTTTTHSQLYYRNQYQYHHAHHNNHNHDQSDKKNFDDDDDSSDYLRYAQPSHTTTAYAYAYEAASRHHHHHHQQNQHSITKQQQQQQQHQTVTTAMEAATAAVEGSTQTGGTTARYAYNNNLLYCDAARAATASLTSTPATTPDAAEYATEDIDAAAVGDLSQRLQMELRAAKSRHLACTEVSLPWDLTPRIAAEILRTSEREPCGVRGCTIFIEFEDEPNNTRRIASFKVDPNTVSTFELYLILRNDKSGWTSKLPQFLKNLTRSSTIQISPDFTLTKNKLYSCE